MASSGELSASMLMVEEYFNAEDARFVGEIQKIWNGKALAGFIERWKKDSRPWSRAQILKYLETPLNCPGHQVIVKRLFKHAWAQGDDEAMAAFMAAFDTLVRRDRYTKHKWDWQSRTSWEEEALRTPRNTMKGGPSVHTARNPRSGAENEVRKRIPRGGMLFSYHTRYYLRRRAWRYFRRLAKQRPASYAPAITKALLRYRDEDFAQGENIIDSWSMMHACFGAHDAVQFNATHASLKEGRSLGELDARPFKPELWAAAEAFPLLLELASKSEARLIRVWAMQLLRREHAERLKTVSMDALVILLDHPDDEVQQFGANLLQNMHGLEKLNLTVWMRLLETKNLTALELLCQAMSKHVTHDRLDLAQCVTLACVRQTPIAKLGERFLRQKTVQSSEDRKRIAGVAETKCAAASVGLAEWALAIVGAAEHYDRDSVTRFFDSLHAPAREKAWGWLTRQENGSPVSPGFGDTVLWAQLLETPYDDLRLRLIDLLDRRSKMPGTNTDMLAPVWCSVLLAVKRGGRQKSKAIRQIGSALRQDPSQAERLLPILSVALRSVRGPERRAALSAVVGALAGAPGLLESVRRMVPDLELEPVEAQS